jgi:Ca2+-transporting ATPase
MANTPAWHALAPEAVAETLITDLEKGLGFREAARRLSVFGKNQLQGQKPPSPWVLFINQFRNFMVYVLLGAMGISFALGEFADGATVLAIILINAVLGFVQEFRAEKALTALKKLTSPEATVIRDGCEKRIPAVELVPGDLVRLETGDRIPADIRLIKAVSLEVEEAILTGESQPVAKDATIVLPVRTELGERKNMVFQGCLITKGRGLGIVVGTGMNTEMGRICEMLKDVGLVPTPLQLRLEKLGKVLVVLCVYLCALITFTGIVRGESVYQMFLAGVSLAVAAIPEGLPAVVAVALATGVQRLSKKGAIVRRLQAVETLGCVTVICCDKTGTLTLNEMTLQEIFLDGRRFFISGSGYKPRGDFYDQEGQKIEPGKTSVLRLFLEIAALCNNARLAHGKVVLPGMLRWRQGKEKHNWELKGDPTEGALLVAAGKAGIWREEWERKWGARVQEIPFDSERKMMSTVYVSPQKKFLVFTKGAPEKVLEHCSAVLERGQIIPFTQELKEKVARTNQEMAGRALRVLALAYKEVDQLATGEIETDLIFVGLGGIKDPLRPAARHALEACRKAGIRVVMVTGDHPLTAAAVAKELGLVKAEENLALTGQEIDRLSERELSEKLKTVSIFARVSPLHKLRIVRALKNSGEIVAMTGDGVNDAPALKEADVGVAMGRSGTDVAKEAAAVVLTNDEFATIVKAIEEGRGIYENIRKFIRYLLACNLGEVLTMFFAILAGFPLPLLPIQILWVNLVTDGLPAVALGVDNPEPGLMEHPPRPPGEDVFARGMAKKILVWGFLIGLSSFLVFVVVFLLSGELVRARTAAFCCLVFAQLVHVFDCRSSQCSLFDVCGNSFYIISAVGLSFLMQLAVVSVPFLRDVFQTVPLSGLEWTVVLLAAGGASIGNGLVSWFYRIVKRRLMFALKPRTTGHGGGS